VVAQVTDHGPVMDHSLLAHLIWEDHNLPLTLIVTTLITTSHTVHGGAGGNGARHGNRGARGREGVVCVYEFYG